MNTQSNQTHIFRIVWIALILITELIHSVSGQSVYVGKAGAEGKVLRKYIEPTELKKLVDNPVDSIWILDVRSENAYLNGHIPTARSFPSGTIMSHLNEIPKDKYLIIYCTVGGMARIVSKKLKRAGYKRYMDWGGISRWKGEKETEINLQPTL
ncbi:MAG TPA: rhodanese-like domain-containing protein [Prolixibacteraceae bacterium]|nr:rhodanese-like domain-containing protein [Prolixibacteraceae bacterium]